MYCLRCKSANNYQIKLYLCCENFALNEIEGK